ncbi:hypothetical protein NMY22_g11941 [Coprinellus aureogranulatus]|nr:hypothetical protein NMY22_g11941 [Coprinellus aureogranulatus]
MPLLPSRRSGFSFKQGPNGSLDIKDDEEAQREFQYSSNAVLGVSLTYQTSGKPLSPPTIASAPSPFQSLYPDHTQGRASTPEDTGPSFRRPNMNLAVYCLRLMYSLASMWACVKAWLRSARSQQPALPLTSRSNSLATQSEPSKAITYYS